MRPWIIPILACTALAAQSPMFRGDAARTGVYPAPAVPLQGKIAWSFETLPWKLYKGLEDMDGQPTWPTTPAVSDGLIYGCAGPFFFAVDAKGKEAFRVRLGGSSLSSPAVANGVAYLPTGDGLLYALDAKNGKTLWTFRIAGPSRLRQTDQWDVYQSSPAVVDGIVYVGSVDGAVYAISASKGELKWRTGTGDIIRSSPAVANGRVFAGNFSGKVFCLDAATGARVWEQDTHTPGVPWHAVQGSCAVSGGLVFVGSRSTSFYAFEEATGKLRWKHGHRMSWVPSSPAVRDGVAYVGQSDGGKVTAIGADGTVRWVLDIGKPTFASPALAGGVVYVATNDNYNSEAKGSLSAVDILTGKAIWTCSFPASLWSSPVVANDTVYVACADGNLYAVK
ncbi:MAG: PQQ-binding-like beta-propeller repeat protein [Acidobacteria bacterium]|nr:PQQ-binding-like beta-propeller repeat protein [Acidobacteriota bacterium]MBI3488532.1 PQQ-binding-like beta-propeller repeat protein [Acidobacteriota bacterium]